MHTYRKITEGDEEVWEVGYWFHGYEMTSRNESRGFHNWKCLKVFKSQEVAAGYVNFLNGGEGHGYFVP